MALGHLYVDKHFDAESRERALAMVRGLEDALEVDLTTSRWMAEETKRQALHKLRTVCNRIGYPDHWRDYTALHIVRGDALGNSLRADIFEQGRQIATIAKPRDPDDWAMTPPTVNAE